MRLRFPWFPLVGGVVAVALALLAASTARASGNAPPDNLNVSGTTLTWRDNSADESGFQVSIMPIGGQGAPVFTHDVAANSTSFDLASDQRACAGPIAVGVAALMPDGVVLIASSLVTANVASACVATTATPVTGTPVPSATPRSPGLPSTGTGDPPDSSRSRAVVIALFFGLITALGISAAANRARKRA
jgi:hypothetical protein